MIILDWIIKPSGKLLLNIYPKNKADVEKALAAEKLNESEI
jgi:hypothetical protein